MSNQNNKHCNNQGIYDECRYCYDKIGQDTPMYDDYNFSAGDYSEDIDTDVETPTSIISSKAVEPTQYIKIHQNLTPIEPHEIPTTQNPSVSKKIMQGINSQRHYLPHQTAIVTSSKCHPQPADVTEIYRRHCKKNKVTATITPQQQTQRSPMLMLSHTPTTILDQNSQPQYCQQQPHLVLRCVPTRAEDEQQIYVTNNSRNYSCRYCATELLAPIQNQQQQKQSTTAKRYIQHCVAVDTAEPVIEYYEQDLVDEYSDGIVYDDSPCDLVPTTKYQEQHQQHRSPPHYQYPHSSPQLQEMRDIQRSVTTVTNGATADVNPRRNVIQAPPMLSNTATVKSTIRGSSPINGGINNGICNSNDAVDGYILTRLQHNGGNNIRHRFKPSREYASTHAPIPVSGNGNNTDHIPPSMRPHTTQGDVIQTSQVHYHVTPHPPHRQRHRTTVLAPRYYKRTSNGGGTALYKPPSKLCLPVFSQPEYPSFIAAAHKKHRTHNTSSRNNRTLQPQQHVDEAMNDASNNSERVEYESAPPFYTAPDGSYKVIQQERFPLHPKRKLKNKLLTLRNPKRDSNNTPCDMEGLLAHFENLFDIKEKEYADELSSSKENVKDRDKTIPLNVESVKCTPSQATLRRSRLSSLLLKSKQENKKFFTKLKKCDSTTSQQTVVSKTRLKKKHDKTSTSKTNSLKINNSINDNKNNDNDNIDSNNKNMIDDITLTLNNKTTSTPKEELASLVDDQQSHEQPQHPFSNDMTSDSLDNLLADLMASGYINQKQHDKSKLINQKMREEAQKIINAQSICCSSPSPNTSMKRLTESSPDPNQILAEEGDNNTYSCVGSTDNTSDGEIAVINSSKTNNTMTSSTHNMSIHVDNNGNTNAGENDEHGICKTTGATTSMPTLSPSNNDNNHTISNNTTSSPNADNTKNSLPTNNNSYHIPRKIESQNLSLLKSDQTKSYSHISSQTNNNEAKVNAEFLTKSTTSNLKCDTESSKTNLLQMNIPLKSTTGINHHNTHHDEDRTVALELHRSKSYIIKLIDRALSKELGTAPEPRLTLESPSTTHRHRILLNTNIVNNKEKTENISHLVTNSNTRSATTDVNVEVSKESKPSTSSFKVHTEEASCMKQLKLLRWSHLKHIQEEVQRLQDLERFLDSCNASNPK